MVLAYSFTSAPIAQALLEAHKRGLKVLVVLDKSQKTEKYSSADFLRNVGIPVWIDSSHAIAHNKVMVIDGDTVITGSFNFSKAAEESNAENLLIINNAALAREYESNWRIHVAHSREYEGREPPQQAGRWMSFSLTRRKETVPRWGTSREVLLKQVDSAGETLLWLGDPRADGIIPPDQAEPCANKTIQPYIFFGCVRRRDGSISAQWQCRNACAEMKKNAVREHGELLWCGRYEDEKKKFLDRDKTTGLAVEQ